MDWARIQVSGFLTSVYSQSPLGRISRSYLNIRTETYDTSFQNGYIKTLGLVIVRSPLQTNPVLVRFCRLPNLSYITVQSPHCYIILLQDTSDLVTSWNKNLHQPPCADRIPALAQSSQSYTPSPPQSSVRCPAPLLPAALNTAYHSIPAYSLCVLHMKFPVSSTSFPRLLPTKLPTILKKSPFFI